MTESTPPRQRRRAWWGLRRVSMAMVVLGLILVAVTSALIRSSSDQNQRNLLSQQATLAAGSVASLASQVKAVLDSATAAAVAVHDPAAFRALMGAEAPYFASFVVVVRHGDSFTPSFTVGHPAVDIAHPPAGVQRELVALTPGEFDVTGFTVVGTARVLGVAERSTVDHSVIVYAEVPLPAYTQASGPTADLEYAVYTDASERASSLVLASTSHLPLAGRRAIIAVPLDGSSVQGKPLIGGTPGEVRLPPDHLLMVVTAAGRLGGVLAADLWIVLLAAGLLALAGGVLAVELVQRRRDEALVMVADLEAKNDALDAALEERAEAERERSMMEVRLRAAQRLETVGKLAGGIAHDFNNLLAVILNYARFVIDDIGEHPARADVEEIERAARRAAELTHQLLVFSRQDIVEPAVVDVNAVVGGMDRLLERTLGEDIEVRTTLDAHPAHVLSSEGELEQVVMNLAVNARDAMAGAGGRLDIVTDRMTVSSTTSSPDGALPAGEYVRLSISDTGTGMSPEVLGRMFEPFFTTKDPGNGTGLGLATVYGIVTRWQGEVSAVSRVGAGTTFTVLLPAVTEGIDDVAPAEPLPGLDERAARVESVLLVEDEPAVRRAACRILEQAGYRVTEAGSGVEVLADSSLARPDVLLTDVVMPGGVSGRDLATGLRQRWPDLPVVYTSGYTADLVAQRGVLQAGVTLVEKPFTAAALLDAIESVLGAVTST